MTDDEAALAVVVVHGIGQQRVGSTLLNWANPLTRSLEELAARDGRRFELSTVRLQRTPPEVDFDLDDKRILLREAHWADAFPAPTASEVFRWAWKFSMRITSRCTRSMLIQPVRNCGEVARSVYLQAFQSDAGWWLRLRGLAVYGGGIFLGVPVVLVVPALYAILFVAAPTLIVVSALLLIVGRWLPFVGSWATAVSAGLVASIGDAFTFTSRRIQAGAMCQAVSDAIDEAVRSARGICVIAHSQGAAIALHVLLQHRATYAKKPVTLITVGAAVNLLKDGAVGVRSSGGVGPAERQRGARTSNVIQDWAKDPFPWFNFWTSLDPVCAGPTAVFDSEHDANQASSPSIGRKQIRQIENCYSAASPAQDWIVPEDQSRRPRRLWSATCTAVVEFFLGDGRGLSLRTNEVTRAVPDEGMIGPEDRRVHNKASLLADHVTYVDNLEQVADPIARILLEAAGCSSLSPEDRVPHVARTRRVRSLGIARLIALATTALVAFQLQDWLNKSSIAGLIATHGPTMIIGMLPGPLEALDSTTDALRVVLGYLWFILVTAAAFLVMSAFTSFLWSWWNAAVQKRRHLPPECRPAHSLLVSGLSFRVWYLVLAAGLALELVSLVEHFGNFPWWAHWFGFGWVMAVAVFGPAALGISQIAVAQRPLVVWDKAEAAVPDDTAIVSARDDVDDGVDIGDTRRQLGALPGEQSHGRRNVAWVRGVAAGASAFRRSVEARWGTGASNV